MRIILTIFTVFSFLFVSGCWMEEEVIPPVSQGLSPKNLYLKASEEINAGTIDAALKTFDALQAAYPASKYTIQSKLDSIYALYKFERYNEAIELLDEYLKLYPNHFTSEYALYLKGLIFENKSKSIIDDYITDIAQRDSSSVLSSLQAYIDLIKKYPNSKYSEEAKDKLIILRNVLARHELFIAIFYTKKNANISAINRCKFIIEKYPNTPSVPAALHLIAHNYQILGMEQLAIDSERVLKLSYPDYKPHYTLD